MRSLAGRLTRLEKQAADLFTFEVMRLSSHSWFELKHMALEQVGVTPAICAELAEIDEQSFVDACQGQHFPLHGEDEVIRFLDVCRDRWEGALMHALSPAQGEAFEDAFTHLYRAYPQTRATVVKFAAAWEERRRDARCETARSAVRAGPDGPRGLCRHAARS